MTLRTKSRAWQWMVWLAAALVFLVLYVVLSRHFYNVVGWNPLDVRCHRLMLPLAVLFVLIAHETRWDGVVRKKAREKVKVAPDPVVRVTHAHTEGERARGVASTGKRAREVASATEGERAREVTSATEGGEELFNQARALPHQPIPDFRRDGKYLELLGRSAAQGYAPAMAKLGEYAMRRAAWVEAYYWMTLARRNGMHGLSPTLLKIRQRWAMAGFPNESRNASRLFPVEAGALGRALLNLDSGRSTSAAREFLKAHHPEFVHPLEEECRGAHGFAEK